MQKDCNKRQKDVYLQSKYHQYVTISIHNPFGFRFEERFDTLCEGFGMSATTAFNIFVRMVVRQRRIPFEIELSEKDESYERGRKAFLDIRRQAEAGRYPDMTLDEINEEIRLAREGR